MTKPYTISWEENILKLKSDPEVGLSRTEAEERLLTYGPNKLLEKSGKSILRILWHQINNFLSYVLIVAAVLSLLSSHQIDAAVIAFLIFINISIGFYYEYTAEKRVKSLKDLIQKRCVVIRGGKESVIDPQELVIGDIVLLEDGKSVPADIRVISSKGLSAAEASLTGESAPVKKQDCIIPSETALGDRSNMLYMGTYVTTGECRGVVVATGIDTELGKISVQLDEVEQEKSLFHIRTEKLLKQMVLLSLVTTTIAVVLLAIRGATLDETLQFTFAKLISGIPEGLPSVLTVLLSIASVRMSRKNALLRNLPAIETLSTVTTIITDKTGTLTQNVMSIQEFMLADGQRVGVTGSGWEAKGKFMVEDTEINPVRDLDDASTLFSFLALASQGDVTKVGDKYELSGYPTEIARYVLARKGGIDKKKALAKFKILDTQPYDQDTKLKSLLVKEIESGENFFIIIGGAENVLKLAKNSSKISKYIYTNATSGHRMQAIAYKPTKSVKISDQLHRNLTPLAAFTISDPMRVEVPEAIDSASKAGIRVIMATGDHVATAFEIARQAGIIPAEAEKIEDYAISQSEIDKMSESEFNEAVKRLNVFARVTPATKLRIATILRGNGEVIAMTGDGVNDAPVLKGADIGIAMGLMGTDVAKEASDLILLDDSFATIIDAIKEGRTVFNNIRQTSLYLITTNFAEDLMILISVFVGLPLPLIPIQILWLNLVTDGLSDVALATESSHQDILTEPPRKKDDGIITKRDILFVSTIALSMALMALAFFLYYYAESVERGRTAAFVVMVFMQLFNVINMRSLQLPIIRIGYFTNRAINASLLISLILTLIALYTSPMREIFQFSYFSALDFMTAVLASSLVLLIGEIYKSVRERRFKYSTLLSR